MIPLAEINTFSSKLGVPAETIEKDYFISWILYCLANSDLKKDFIFYGGTAIKRIYFEEHRFSEDIDLLSAKQFSLNSILDSLNCLDLALNEANLSLNVNEKNIIAGKNRIQMYVNYAGYDEIVGAPKEIRLDFAMNMDLFGVAHKMHLIKTYSDIKMKDATLTVMSLNTILANKLGLLLDRTRNEPRDLFDLWFLLNRLEKFDYVFEEMNRAFKDKYGYRLSYSILAPRLKNNAMKDNWVNRLKKQMSILPTYDIILEDIDKKLKLIFFEDLSEK